MDLADVESLRKAFDSIDLDHSGTIEHTELREALLKAGKKPTDAQCKTVLEKYAKSQKGSMTFEEYQKMIAEWDDVIAGVDGATPSKP